MIGVVLEKEKLNTWQFAVQGILAVLTIIWICGVPKVYEEMFSVEDCFDEDEYKSLVEKYKYKWLGICSEYSGIAHKRINYVKVSYQLIWAVLSADAVYILFYKMHIISLWSAIFLFNYAVLSSFSSFRCIVFVYFLRHILKIDKLSYNKYYPSMSYGYQRLSMIVQFMSKTYLLLAFLFTVVYFMCIFPEILSLKNNTSYFIVVFSVEILLSWGTLIINYCLPEYYLYKLSAVWALKSLKSFQERLKCLHEPKDTQQYLCYINMLKEDCKRTFPVLEVTIGILTLTLNVISLIL